MTTYAEFLADKVRFDTSYGHTVSASDVHSLLLPHQRDAKRLAGLIKSNVAGGADNTNRPLTRSLDLGKEGLAVDATRKKLLDSTRYGRLTVEASVPGGWLCRCDCGASKVVTGTHLREGRVQSCGCYHRERQREIPRKHGMKQTAVYRAWVNMRQRCNNPNRPDWENYGGRGIRVCEQWNSFKNFLRDMGEPSPGQSIDRIDVDGNYEPRNCRWANGSEQSRNKRTTKLISIDGVEKSLADWCDDRGLNYWTAHARLRRGATPEEALRA